MKNLLIILLLIVSLSGCRSTKKITESSAITSNQSDAVQKIDIQENAKIINDKLSEEETVITITEYFAPEATNTNTVTAPVIKSVTTKVTKKKEVDKGKVETEKKDNSQIATKTKAESKIEAKQGEKKIVPIQWGWIFGILVICAGAFIYLKRSKVFPWIKSVLSRVGIFRKI